MTTNNTIQGRVQIRQAMNGEYEAGLICGDGRFGLVAVDDDLARLHVTLEKLGYHHWFVAPPTA